MFKMIPYHFRKNNFNKVLLVCLFAFFVLTIFFLQEVSKRDAAVKQLEFQVSQLQHGGIRHLSETSDQDGEVAPEDDVIIIYNRVPKTGSTSFAGIAYELCSENRYHVLHVNTTKNSHTISIPDQIHFIQNITKWSEKKPAIYHGHFYYIDFVKLGYNDKRPMYINIVRKPLDRLLSYYYFVRYGDDFRPHLIRRKQGNQMTFDECVERDHKDCDPVHLWLQIPFFCGHSYRCRQPGSRWALEQAKFNLIHNYLLVGVTEELGDFIAMLEIILPRFFKGAMDLYMNGEKSHLRKTNKKDLPSKESVAKIQESSIWRMENEFYEFALDQFHFQKHLVFKNEDEFSEGAGIQNQQTFVMSDGQLYVSKGLQFHYEKVRPR